VGRVALIVAATSAALALAGPMALRPFADAAGAAGSAGEVAVGFVIDFGTGTTPAVGCVDVPSTDNRYQALSAFLSEKGMAQPSYNASGLLCSINGVPSSGCGQSVPGGYIYWSYFTGGTGGWKYSSTGAFATVGADDVEGWRFQDPGTGRPNDPAPSATSHYNSICGSGSGSTPTTQPGSTGPGGQATGGGPTAGGTGRRLHVRRGAAAAAAGSGRSHAATTTTTTSPTTTTSTYPDASATSLPAISIPADPEKGLVSAKVPSNGSGPGPDPLIVGGLIVAVLGIAAFARWRRRPNTP